MRKLLLIAIILLAANLAMGIWHRVDPPEAVAPELIAVIEELVKLYDEALRLEEAPAPLTVARIVDGDTFELSDGTMLRLIGIDTPEVHPSAKLSRDAERSGADRETIRELGRRASAYAAELALDKPVELEYGSGRKTDRYGRTLAYVWVLDERGQRLYRVNDRLVADGYASIYSGIPFEYSDQYLEYERTAREEGRGLWGE